MTIDRAAVARLRAVVEGMVNESDCLFFRRDEIRALLDAVEAGMELQAKLDDATAYCSGDFPCEASTSAASLERERNDVRDAGVALREAALEARNGLLDYARVYDDKDAATDASVLTQALDAFDRATGKDK